LPRLALILGMILLLLNLGFHCAERLTVIIRRFNDLAWTDSEDNSRGVIAGALENGSLDLWDADKLINGSRFVRSQKPWAIMNWLTDYKQ
jgi:hypothetical protein